MTRATAMLPALLLCATALAQPKEPEEDSGRRVGGHDFLRSLVIPTPFVDSEFVSATGFGVLSGTPTGGGKSISVAALSQELHLQLGVADFLAIRVGALGGGAVGTDSDSALNFGEYVNYEFSGGAAASFRVGVMRLGVSLDGSLGSQYRLSPNQAIADSLAAGTLSAKTLITSTSTNTLSPGLQVAFGLHPALGIWIHGRFDHGTTSASGTSASTDYVEGGLGLSFDLRPIAGAPVGLLGLYDLLEGVGSTSSTTHTVGAGIFYTGRRDLQLGLEALAQFQSLDTLSLNAYVGDIVIHYFW
jgi:hypothetical protein